MWQGLLAQLLGGMLSKGGGNKGGGGYQQGQGPLKSYGAAAQSASAGPSVGGGRSGQLAGLLNSGGKSIVNEKEARAMYESPARVEDDVIIMPRELTKKQQRFLAAAGNFSRGKISISDLLSNYLGGQQ